MSLRQRDTGVRNLLYSSWLLSSARQNALHLVKARGSCNCVSALLHLVDEEPEEQQYPTGFNRAVNLYNSKPSTLATMFSACLLCVRNFFYFGCLLSTKPKLVSRPIDVPCVCFVCCQSQPNSGPNYRQDNSSQRGRSWTNGGRTRPLPCGLVKPVTLVSRKGAKN